jgi:hypothetical protein
MSSILLTSGPSTLSIFFTLEKTNGGSSPGTEGGKVVEDQENLPMTIVQIDSAQQIFDHSALCNEDTGKLW